MATPHDPQLEHALGGRPATQGPHPGDELITREAFKHNKIKNTLRVAHDGEEGLDFL
jgi:hypothetical protein